MFLLFLDQCVSPTLSRELARLGRNQDAVNEARNLLRTLEIVSILTALLVGGSIVVAAPWIARHGIAGGSLSEDQLITAVRLIGLGIGTQWPGMLYSGGFVGLQRQDILVVIRMIALTVTYGGSALLLWLVAPSIELYLFWTAFMSLVLSASLGMTLWRLMPASSLPARIDPRIPLKVWRFALGNLLIGLMGAMLTQAPSLIVAKYCSLSQLAAYTLSVSLAQQLSTILTQPVTSTLMPHFAQLVYRREERVLAREYHRWTQIIVVLILPVTASLIVFARPLIEIWLGKASPLVEPVSELLPLIALGTLFNTVTNPLYFLQIAAGWTRLSVVKNVVAIAVTLPFLFIFVPRIGPQAAALCWIATNVGYYLFEAPLMHRRLLKKELPRWWLIDTLFPMAIATIIFGCAWLLVTTNQNPWIGVLQAGFTALVTFGVMVWALPGLRNDGIYAFHRLYSAGRRLLGM